MLIFEGKEIETDTEGYLKESSQWSEPLAVVIAENEGISLSPEHWEVVRFVRDFYLVTAAIYTDCFRKVRLSKPPKLLACQNR